ncbi:hypothetical protein HQN64_20240 [Enterobacteriaceae bacterium BIT-l23]|uniref:hypothetical protein n=1 Tax=Jejubacter sp. L23 TaxID=3092086 RepID=UPI001584D8F2|nr:hypothetical protein [Enterobacteriaceae bacterium BIT-l23]
MQAMLGLLLSTVTVANEEHVIDFSKLMRELRLMIKQLPNWKFILLWLVAITAALGYFIGQVRWW